MKFQVLVDNIPSEDGTLEGEWGLSVFIEYNGYRLLLDSGTTGMFAENARRMKIRLEDVDAAVLSHAHDDHAGGMETFFQRNRSAKFYLRGCSQENCYMIKEGELAYIGIPTGWMQTYADRIERVYADPEILPGVTLLSHHTDGLGERGLAAGMYRKIHGVFEPDDFEHEQSLIFRLPRGIVVFNSCCHAGADRVLLEAAEAFPGEQILALIGGFHLAYSTDEEVIALGERLQKLQVEHIVTGHCTGDRAYVLLKELLGGKLQQLRSGFEMEIDSL